LEENPSPFGESFKWYNGGKQKYENQHIHPLSIFFADFSSLKNILLKSRICFGKFLKSAWDKMRGLARVYANKAILADSLKLNARMTHGYCAFAVDKEVRVGHNG